MPSRSAASIATNSMISISTCPNRWCRAICASTCPNASPPTGASCNRSRKCSSKNSSANCTTRVSNRDRFDTLVVQFADEFFDEHFLERLQDAPVGGDAFGHVEAQMARHQRFGQVEIEIIEFVAMLAADLDGIAKSARGKQRSGRAFALDQSVGHQRRAVNQ